MAKTVADYIMTDAASETNSQPFTVTWPEAATQAFLKGWPVQMVGGYLTGITSDTPGNVMEWSRRTCTTSRRWASTE